MNPIPNKFADGKLNYDGTTIKDYKLVENGACADGAVHPCASGP